MKLQFKHQKFQADAAKAVVDVFAGQPFLTPSYMMDKGKGQIAWNEEEAFTGWSNARIVPELSDSDHFSFCENNKPVDEFNHAKSIGIKTVPVLIGPYTFLHLLIQIQYS